MTLTTHALIGVSAASFLPKYPLLAFSAAFLSHFIIDAIPHWDYPIKSLEQNLDNPLENKIAANKKFITDLIRIGFDFLIGITLSFLIFQPKNLIIGQTVFMGAIGGILPDPLQFLYWKIKKEPLISLQRFHIWIHTKTNLNDKPLIGIAFQIILILVAIYLAIKYTALS